MNPFYKLNPIIQWSIAIIIFLIIMIIFGLWFEASSKNLVAYLLVFFIAPFFQFLVTPLFKLLGIYTYISPMILVFGANDKKYDLHNGTPFDYLMVMRGIKPGFPFQRKLLGYYLDGLLSVVEQMEAKELPEDIIVRGSSYFFSENTARRLGFKVSKTSSTERFNLYLNYIDLIWMYSLSKGKLTFPSLKNVKTAEIPGKDLVDNKIKLVNLRSFINRK